MVLSFSEDSSYIYLSKFENEIQAMITFNLFYVFLILLCVYVTRYLASQHTTEG